MKVAVATKHGIAVDLHFGHAHRFWVYDVTSEGSTLLDKRDVEHYCHGQHGSASAMQKILHTIADCEAVFVAKIGDGPARKLEAIGVESVEDYAYEAIEPSLQAFAQRKKA